MQHNFMFKFGGSSVFFDLLQREEDGPKIGAGIRSTGLHTLCTTIPIPFGKDIS